MNRIQYENNVNDNVSGCYVYTYFDVWRQFTQKKAVMDTFMTRHFLCGILDLFSLIGYQLSVIFESIDSSISGILCY
jgi:hypothetical protein